MDDYFDLDPDDIPNSIQEKSWVNLCDENRT